MLMLVALALGCGKSSGDGFGGTSSSKDTWTPDTSVEACESIDADGDGWCEDMDCDDSNRLINPSRLDPCDGIDNDCDGLVDEDLTAYYLDQDGDGYGDDSTAVGACAQPVGYIRGGGDCDDEDPAIHPYAPDACDGHDSDCDGHDGSLFGGDPC